MLVWLSSIWFCPRCQLFHTLSARNFLIVKKGEKLEEVITLVVDHLLLSSDEALALQHLRLLKKDRPDQGSAQKAVPITS